MKHIILLIICCLIAFVSICQVDSLPKQPPQPYAPSGFAEYGYIRTDYGFVNAVRDTLFQPKYLGTEVLWFHSGVDTAKWIYTGAASGPKWIKVGSGATSESIAGGPFTTSNVNVGFNPGSNLTLAQLILKVFYGLKPPTATISGGDTLELTSSSSVNQTLNWSAGRQSNTPTLSSVVVAGITQSFSQPSQGSSVVGTQAVSVPANTTTIYQNIVTASDGQIATASTKFLFLGKKYYGLISDTTGITAGALNSTIIGLSNEFAGSKSLSVNTGSITGTKFWVYAYPSSLGDLSLLWFNNIPALEAMNKITLSIINESGYTQNYTVYYNKQGQTISSDITAQ